MTNIVKIRVQVMEGDMETALGKKKIMRMKGTIDLTPSSMVDSESKK